MNKKVIIGEEFEVEIVDSGARGDGIARIGDFIIFVPGAEKGERVKIKINETGGKFAIAEKLSSRMIEKLEKKEEKSSEAGGIGEAKSGEGTAGVTDAEKPSERSIENPVDEVKPSEETTEENHVGGENKQPVEESEKSLVDEAKPDESGGIGEAKSGEEVEKNHAGDENPSEEAKNEPLHVEESVEETSDDGSLNDVPELPEEETDKKPKNSDKKVV